MKTNPETGFPERRTIKFGTNCDLSDERKWKPQIQVLNNTDDNAVAGYGDALREIQRGDSLQKIIITSFWRCREGCRVKHVRE